ncbi:hypothetical protein CL629_04495 [bacterium]|nr:hypothetical protein [bacterium]
MENAAIKAVTKGPKQHFFGFHDLCPWDEGERHMLAMETSFLDRMPTPKDTAGICLIDLERDVTEVLAETSAWNFQQGARLQWIPNKQDHIIYNDRRDGRFVSVIYDIKKKKEINVLEYPIYAVHPDGTFALGLDFAWLLKHGGYGYTSAISVETQDDGERSIEKENGIRKVNIKTGESKLIISTYSVMHLQNKPGKDEHHVLTHATFNPSGTRICFVDKFLLPDGGFMQRPITANPDGSDLYVLPGHISHFDWKSDTEILGYGKFSPKAMALRKRGLLKHPLLRPALYVARKLRGGVKQKIAGQSYFLLKDKTRKVERIAVGRMTEDGHPQFSPDKKWIVTDTYPDKENKRTLILYNWNTGERIDIERFLSLPDSLPDIKSDWNVSGMRSDLHPRWNRSGTQICFDSVDKESKQIYVADVDSITHGK